MARTHARILTTIWTDLDFIALSADAQRMYLLLLSQDSLDNAGRLPLTLKRWATGCRATSSADVEKALAGLEAARFVTVDYETEEVLIRSFIRNDGIVKQPQMMKSALREALLVRSPLLRLVLARELRRLRREDASLTADQIDPGSPDPDPGNGESPNDSPIQSHLSLPADSPGPAESLPAARSKPDELRRGGGRGSSSPSVSSSSVVGAAKRGTRIPDDFEVTQPMVIWARNECPDVDGRFETSQFIDYWAAKAGKDATKLDWVRVWQTWMRRSQRDVLRRGPHLRAVPTPVRPTDPVAAFDDIRGRAAAAEAARLISAAWFEPSQPPNDPTAPADWLQAQRVAWIDEHADQIRAVLARREAG